MNLENFKTAWEELLYNANPEILAEVIDVVKESVEQEISIRDDKRVSKLREIATELRREVSVSGAVADEKITYPVTGPFSDLSVLTTDEIDDFLYENKDVPALLSKGLLKPPRYCLDCGSANIANREVVRLFNDILPRVTNLQGKTFVDLGSRLGAVVYAALLFAYVFAKMNEKHCDLQRRILERYFNNPAKAKILHGNFLKFINELKLADVILMNNVFTFYHDEEDSRAAWNKLYKVLKSGTVLVHVHSVGYVTQHLNLEFNVEDWLELKYTEPLDEDDGPFCCYVVR